MMRVEFGEGKECLVLGQIDMRIETYSLLINSNPCDADAYNYLGRAYCEKGEFDRAHR